MKLLHGFVLLQTAAPISMALGYVNGVRHEHALELFRQRAVEKWET
ncbi:MAG TPA: hypothetical protein VFZ47_12385 [Chitinophagaceae bacterium]